MRDGSILCIFYYVGNIVFDISGVSTKSTFIIESAELALLLRKKQKIQQNGIDKIDIEV